MATIPGIKISQLAQETTLIGTEEFVFALGGANKKIKASDLGVIGFIADTYVNAATKLANSTLVKGALYFISDKNIYVRALNNNEFALQAVLKAFNADYDNAGNYSGVTAFGSQLGIWYPAITVNQIGDVVIWNNKHWRSVTGATGTAPDGDAVNWSLLAITTTTGFINEIDYIEYDFDADWISRRKDKRGNEFSYPQAADLVILLGYSAIIDFQWGRDTTAGNYVNGAISNNQNFRGTWRGNIHEQNSQTKDILGEANSFFVVNRIGLNILVTDKTLGSAVIVQRNEFLQDFTAVETITDSIEETGKFLTKTITIPTAAVLTLGTIPIEIIPAPGNGLFIDIVEASLKLTFNSIAYATATNPTLYYVGANSDVQRWTSILAATVTTMRVSNEIVVSGVTATQVIENVAVNMTTISTLDPTAGDSDIMIYVTYRIRRI
jgi:hypothetical protein